MDMARLTSSRGARGRPDQPLRRQWLAAALLGLAACSGSSITGPPGPPPPPPPPPPPAPADTALTPISDLGIGTYRGFEGGLYAGGVNFAPIEHDSEGLVRSAQIQPLDAQGRPSATGKIVVLSVGFSNTTQEWCNGDANGLNCTSETLMGRAAADTSLRRGVVVFVDGAQGGQAVDAWDEASDATYTVVKDRRLPARGVTEAQVQVIWLKAAHRQPTSKLPAANADAYNTMVSLGKQLRVLPVRYPNLKMVFMSSRIFAGYATTSLHPEPYAYENGFAIKWVIDAQIQQMRTGAIEAHAGDLSYTTGRSAWLAWGPYLWARSDRARSDGLRWVRDDFVSDGTHPSTSGQSKVGARLLAFFKNSAYTRCWLLRAGCP
jgi:hypothetical protein